MVHHYHDILFKDWVRGKRLGSGSYGCVYLALRTKTADPPFAVKSAPFADFDLALPLQKEERILEQFPDCDQIVTCYGTCFSHEFNTLVFNLHLEYAPGGSLLDLIRGYGGKMPESLVKKCTGMILKGLSRIHARGIVHCDLKPANILVFPNNEGVRVKLADFGLAIEPGWDKVPPPRMFRGTPDYMSPESVEMDIGPPLDIWSLGCVVLQMLTGHLPWGGLKKSGLVKKLFYEKEAPRIPDGGVLSNQGKDFLMRCFELEPSKRWTADMLLTHPFICSHSY